MSGTSMTCTAFAKTLVGRTITAVVFDNEITNEFQILLDDGTKVELEVWDGERAIINIVVTQQANSVRVV